MEIRYITSHGSAERVKFVSGKRDTLALVAEPYHSGAVVLGEKFFPLVSGRAEIPLASLSDGEYFPRFESERGIFLGEGFTKSGMSIAPKVADEDFVRRLSERCYRLENEMRALKERVEKLESACSGHNIFDFERKEK